MSEDEDAGASVAAAFLFMRFLAFCAIDSMAADGVVGQLTGGRTGLAAIGCVGLGQVVLASLMMSPAAVFLPGGGVYIILVWEGVVPMSSLQGLISLAGFCSSLARALAFFWSSSWERISRLQLLGGGVSATSPSSRES